MRKVVDFTVLLQRIISYLALMKVIINAKGSKELKEAIQLAAMESRKKGERVNMSAYIIKVLMRDPLIKKYL